MTTRAPVAISSAAAIRSMFRGSIPVTSRGSRRVTRCLVRRPSLAVPRTAVSADAPLRRDRSAGRRRRLAVATDGDYPPWLASGRGEKLARVALGRASGVVTAEHPADLVDDPLGVEPLDCRPGRLASILLQPEVGRGKRGHLREVGDADHLPAAAEVAQALADGTRGVAADAGVDLVEDEGSGTGALAEAGQRQH